MTYKKSSVVAHLNRKTFERAEVIAHALSDFERFCQMLVWIRTKKGKATTLRFNDIQARYNASRTWRDVVLKPRQIGLSTIELARDVWKFLQPGQRVLIIVQADADNVYVKKFAEDISRIFTGLKRAGLALNFGEESVHRWTLPGIDSSLQLMSAGASRDTAVKKGRGDTYSRVHSTESAFYQYPELTLNAVLEAVPNLPDTEIVFESTPNGANNWFHALYTNAKAHKGPYTAHFFPWFQDSTYRTQLLPGERIAPENEREQLLIDVHGIDLEQLKFYQDKIRSKNSRQLVEQEYASDDRSCFLKSGRPFFDIDSLDRGAKLISEPIEHNDAGLRVWADAKPHTQYLISVDPAEGLGPDGNDSVATVWTRRSPIHVATLANKMPAEEFADPLIALSARYNNAQVVFERNKGMALCSALILKGFHNFYREDDGKPGIFTSESSKAAMLSDLRTVLRDGSCKSPDFLFHTQLGSFVIDPRTGRPHAPSKDKKDGISDDVIMAAAIGWQLLLRPPPSIDIQLTQPRNFSDFGDRFGDSQDRGW